MKTLIILLAVFIGIVYTLPAKPYLHNEVNLEINYPESWFLEVPSDFEDYDEEDYDENIYLASPDEDFLLIGSILWETDFKEAVQAMQDFLAEDYESLKIINKKETTINGMKAITGKGTVQIDYDYDNDLYFAILDAPDGNLFLFYGIAETATLKKYEKAINGIVSGTKIMNNAMK